ncbi:hypothetical protein VVD49_07650 [Uliginosibacterium sp. H3]|uniref:EpsG family protein n=1 Tax=Uliginosibacterium silvisoli TaxID=3114758 RepID=A0ABU6K1R6_9RHOO|nr:hypothetical protein [Uliginosibacterium sp. H3]
MRHDAALQNIVLIVILIILSAIKTRGYLLDGRLWAEEATDFFSGVHGKSFISAFCYVYKGQLQIVTNIIVWLGTLVPINWLPFATTSLSYAVQSVPILYLIMYRTQLEIGFLQFLGFLIVYHGLPQSEEVFSTATNVQWHLGLLAAVLVILPVSRGWRLWLSRLLLVACGLGGVPACIVAPVALARYAVTRDRERLVQGAVLAMCALIQLSMLLLHGADAGGGRSVDFRILVALQASSFQQIYSPVFGPEFANFLAPFVRNGGGVFEVFSICLVLCFYYFFAREKEWAPFAVLCSAMMVLVSYVGALDDRLSLISAAVGGRYFFAPNVLLCLVLAAATSKTVRGLYGVIFATCVVSSVAYGFRANFSGPAWRDAYRACMDKPECDSIQVWPPGWSLKRPKEGW